jgi:hypothetical protein
MRYFRLDGRVQCASEWARELNVSHNKFSTRNGPAQLGLAPCDRYGVTDADALEPAKPEQKVVAGGAS